jgi:hypothetical protein
VGNGVAGARPAVARPTGSRRSVNGRALWNALQPHHQNVYVNFLMEEGEDRIRECPGGLPSEHV